MQLVISEFISLDGVIEGPGPDDPFAQAGWTMPYVSEPFMEFKTQELEAAEALLLGRITYEGFAKAWPLRKGADAFSDKMNSIKKYVASTTLSDLAWENSQLLSGDVVEAVRRIKSEGEGDLLVAGSSVLSKTLIDAGLVDELRLLTYPVVLGEGKRFFKDGTRANFALKEAKDMSKGVVLLTYTRAKDA